MATNTECVGLPIESFDDLWAFTEQIIDEARSRDGLNGHCGAQGAPSTGPEEHVAEILPVDDHSCIAASFAGFMLSVRPVP